jgi:hypothetical protein
VCHFCPQSSFMGKTRIKRHKRTDRSRNLTGIRKPIFGSPGPRDYQRRRRDLKFIVENEFPKRDQTLGGRIVQATGSSKSIMCSCHKNWPADHGGRPWNDCVHARQRRIFPNDEETRIREFIMSNDRIPGPFLMTECSAISLSRHF